MLKENRWQLQNAKMYFSHLVNLVEKGASIEITSRGNEIAVLISKERYDQLTKKKSLLDCFLSALCPDLELVSRAKELPRDIEL